MTTKTAGKKKAAAPAAAQPAPRQVGTHVVRLSDPEMQPAMEKLKARIAADPAFAHSLLHSAGIVNAKGKLTKHYGG